MTETPYYLNEGRSLYFYRGAAGTLEAVNAAQERKEKLDRLDMLAVFEEVEG